MAKTKKKRTKAYRGKDSKRATQQVVKVAAVDRGRLRQWWYEKKRVAKPIIITAAVIVIVVWLLGELFRAIFA